MTKTVAILDYGISNLHNVSRMVEQAGGRALITCERADVLAADALILPGVGAFAEAMRHMHADGVTDAVRELAARDHPILGICLGMQLLFETSCEGGVTIGGLGVFPGSIERLPARGANDGVIKVPQIGWNRLLPGEARRDWSGTVLDRLPGEPYMYFLHSYYPMPQDPGVTVAETVYGGLRFASVVQRGRVAGCQFHPERSGPLGSALLSNFLSII